MCSTQTIAHNSSNKTNHNKFHLNNTYKWNIHQLNMHICLKKYNSIILFMYYSFYLLLDKNSTTNLLYDSMTYMIVSEYSPYLEDFFSLCYRLPISYRQPNDWMLIGSLSLRIPLRIDVGTKEVFFIEMNRWVFIVLSSDKK
jgi:hypothetical protein